MVIGVIPPSPLSNSWGLPIELAPARLVPDENGAQTTEPVIYDTIRRLLYAGAELLVIPLNNTTSHWLPPKLQSGGGTIGCPIIYTFTDGNTLKAIDSAYHVCKGNITLVLQADATYKFQDSAGVDLVSVIEEKEADMVVGRSSSDASIFAWNAKGADALHEMFEESAPTVSRLSQAVSRLGGVVKLRQLRAPSRKPPTFALP
jgi:hypothetical protein